MMGPKSFRLGSRERAAAAVQLAQEERNAKAKPKRMTVAKKLRAPIANEPFNRAAHSAGIDDGAEGRPFGSAMRGVPTGMRSYMAGFKHGKWMRDHEF